MKHIEILVYAAFDIGIGKNRYTVAVPGFTAATRLTRDAAVRIRQEEIDRWTNRPDVDSVHAQAVPAEYEYTKESV